MFSSDPLDEPLEVIGEVAAELSVTRDNPYADLFVRLCDVDPRGRSYNVCDGIVRLTGADPLTGTVRVSLLGTAHRFGSGISMSEHMSPATRTPLSGRNTAPCPGACPSCTISRASGPSHGMAGASSARIRPASSRS